MEDTELKDTMNRTFLIREEGFPLTSVADYVLTISLGPEYLRLSVVDPRTNHCGWLEEFALTSAGSEEEYLSAVQQLVGQHEILTKNFWKLVRVVVSNQSFTLVPASLFRKEYAARCLSLAKGAIADHEFVHHTVHTRWEAVNVFSLGTQLAEWFFENYPFENLQVHHQVDLLLEMAARFPEDGLLLYLEKHAATLLFIRNGKLHYCNRFLFRTGADLLYYLLFAISELKIDAEHVPAWAFGEITEDDELYKGLYKYLGELKLGLPDSLNLPAVSGEVPLYVY